MLVHTNLLYELSYCLPISKMMNVLELIVLWYLSESRFTSTCYDNCYIWKIKKGRKVLLFLTSSSFSSSWMLVYRQCFFFKLADFGCYRFECFLLNMPNVGIGSGFYMDWLRGLGSQPKIGFAVDSHFQCWMLKNRWRVNCAGQERNTI